MEVIQRNEQGSLTIVGLGIRAISQVTPETSAQIECADSVFYHAPSGIMARFIRQLNSNAFDLYQLYGEDKRRRTTYIQMAELMLRDVRQGRRVVGVFQGHPGFFVMAARRSLAIAKNEGYTTAMLPGISAVDCLISDLRIDPGVNGLHIVKAGSYLRDKQKLASWSNVVLLQVSSAGDTSFSFSGYKNSKTKELFMALSAEYGSSHDCVYYVAPTFAGVQPVIEARSLAEWCRESRLVGSGMLYLPPIGLSLGGLESRQAYSRETAYDDFALRAIDGLAAYRRDPSFKHRDCSRALFEVMRRLASEPKSLEQFRHDPDKFLEAFPDLSLPERQALLSESTAALRAVTTSTGSDAGRGGC